MQSSKRVLVAVDGSIHSLNAVNYVVRNCSPSTHVGLIYIMPKRPEEVFWQVNMEKEFLDTMRARYARWEEEQLKAGRAFLDSTEAVLVNSGFSRRQLSTMVCQRQLGTASDIMVQAQNGYDALVVGRRGLNRMNSLFLGSVSDKIVEGVHNLAVWVVGGDVHRNRILAAVDGSENSAKAVAYVAGFTAEARAEITLCHVIRGQESLFGAPVFELGQDIESRIDELMNERVREMFEGCLAILAKAGVPAHRVTCRCIRRSFSRAADILREAREGGYGTIVMGRRGISKVREFLMGRVTTKVLNGAEDLAVWIVP